MNTKQFTTTFTKTSDLIGKKVLSKESGKQFAKVQDIVIDQDTLTAICLVVDKGGWFSNAEVIPFEHVDIIGEDRVMVENENVVTNAKEFDQTVKSAIRSDSYIEKANIITKSGKKLGTLKDLYINRFDGTISMVEVSEGFFNTIFNGPKDVNTSRIETIGNDAIIVEDETSVTMEIQSEHQGVKGAMNDAQSTGKEIKENVTHAAQSLQDTTEKKLTEAYNRGQEISNDISHEVDKIQDPEKKDIVDKSQETSQKMYDSMKEKIEDTFDKTKNKIIKNRKKAAVGTFLKKDIRDDDTGELVAESGDFINKKLIQKAENHDVLTKVLANHS